MKRAISSNAMRALKATGSFKSAASKAFATLSLRPAAFDLRNATFGQESGSFVTPVKFQNPFGSCWAFAAVAAAETSTLTEYGAAVDNPERDDLVAAGWNDESVAFYGV